MSPCIERSWRGLKRHHLAYQTSKDTDDLTCAIHAATKRLNKGHMVPHPCWGGRPRGILCQGLVVSIRTLGTVRMKLKRIGLDTSKAVFTLHGVGQDEKAVLRRDMRRAEMEAFFAKLPPTHVALEGCGGSHHWGRRLAAMGHTVQLIPPQYVKPFVRRGKNDRNDAEAISEAAARPDMPSVPVRSAGQQAEAVVLSARELLVRQRT